MLTRNDRLAARAYIAQRRDYLESPGTQRLVADIGPEDDVEDMEDDAQPSPASGAD